MLAIAKPDAGDGSPPTRPSLRPGKWNARVNVRLTQEEWQRFSERASEEGMSLAAWIRACCWRARRPRAPRPAPDDR